MPMPDSTRNTPAKSGSIETRSPSDRYIRSLGFRRHSEQILIINADSEKTCSKQSELAWAGSFGVIDSEVGGTGE